MRLYGFTVVGFYGYVVVGLWGFAVVGFCGYEVVWKVRSLWHFVIPGLDPESSCNRPHNQ